MNSEVIIFRKLNTLLYYGHVKAEVLRRKRILQETADAAVAHDVKEHIRRRLDRISSCIDNYTVAMDELEYTTFKILGNT